MIDFVILAVYLAVTLLATCGFVGQTRTADAFMSAGRSLPAWVVGLSLFGSYVSSITFLANPGKAYAGNWNAWVFALTLPLAAWIATTVFVPFFRQSGEVSAYHHLEHRFGPWARTYGVVCYLLTQILRLAIILYLLAVALSQFIPLRVETLIVISGVIVSICPLLGGTAGVMWVGVLQSLVLLAGAVICVVQLLLDTPGSAAAIWERGLAEQKFSLGTLDLTWAKETFWVTLFYGLAINLQNFGIDQSYVQKYITAKSDVAAKRSVWYGGLAYIPLSAAFLWIGTSLFVFYAVQPSLLPDGLKTDDVFPYFLRTELPVGLRGLVLAAICAAALDSNLNCCATLVLCDIDRRYFRPQMTDEQGLGTLRVVTIVLGAISTGAAVLVATYNGKAVLDLWWDLAGIASGGILGLFLLGLTCRRADSLTGAIATTAGVAVILGLTMPRLWKSQLGQFALPLHPNWTIVFGTLCILGVGWLISFARPQPQKES